MSSMHPSISRLISRILNRCLLTVDSYSSCPYVDKGRTRVISLFDSVSSFRLILTDDGSQIFSLCSYKTEKSVLFFSLLLPPRERVKILKITTNNISTYSHKHYYTDDKCNEQLKIRVTDPHFTLCQNSKNHEYGSFTL